MRAKLFLADGQNDRQAWHEKAHSPFLQFCEFVHQLGFQISLRSVKDFHHKLDTNYTAGLRIHCWET
jgi:hypothetical protein